MRWSGGWPGRFAPPYLALLFTSCVLSLRAQDELPGGKGKETLENTCTECHGLDKVLNQLRTEQQWRAIAIRMRSKGATMTDDELKSLVDYLSQNFGALEDPQAKSASAAKRAKLDVNMASAKEIQTVLELSPAEAAAIVRYRETKGPFRKWRDLRKVKGLDKSRIEALKDRITF
jgi:competence ComEA-like helix-hairpin-helix protein